MRLLSGQCPNCYLEPFKNHNYAADDISRFELWVFFLLVKVICLSVQISSSDICIVESYDQY